MFDILFQQYEAMDAGAKPLLPIYLIIGGFAVYITILLFKRWKERKSEPTKWLSLAFMMYSFLIIVITIGYLEMYITGYKMEIYKISLALGYSGLMIANCFLIRFAVFIFGKEKEQRVAWIYIVISIFIAVLVALPINYYGVPTALVPPEHANYRMIFSGLMMIFSVITYSSIYRQAHRISKALEDRWASIGMRLIGYSQLSQIGFFIFTLADTLAFTFGNVNGYTPFIYFSWVLTALFLLFSYLGLIMPQWFRKWLSKSK